LDILNVIKLNLICITNHTANKNLQRCKIWTSEKFLDSQKSKNLNFVNKFSKADKQLGDGFA